LVDGAPSESDIFLSYAREDETRARQLAEALEQHGFAVFWDREIPPGETWHSHIGRALVNAKCVVVAWTRHSIASDWVIEEASEGKRRKILVPVLFEEVQPPFGFRAIQAAGLVDWRHGRSSPAFDGLLRAVQRIVVGQAGSGTEPEVEVAALLQPAPAESAPRTKPTVRPSAPAPASSELRAERASLPYRRASRWSGWTAGAMVAGFVALAGAGGIAWWLTQPGPAAEPPAPGYSIAEPKPSEPLVETAPSAPERTSAASIEAGEAREAMRDCAECPEMVLVSAGEFTMGSPPGEAGRDYDEGPQRKVTLAEPFWAGKYEVTFAEWDACVAAGGCSSKPDDAGWGRDNRPVVNVNWNDAKEYVGWLSEKTGKAYRLMSEAEWEYVARAGGTTAFWWGDDVGRNNASCNACGSEWDGKSTAPVGSFAANSFGLHDTAGNVWEWVEDCYGGSYASAPKNGAAWEDGDDCSRVVRGGSWYFEPRSVRSANRIWDYPQYRRNDGGFRVARAPD
jgi:formylglycine-generating enzyme required for sulfatase activity